MLTNIRDLFWSEIQAATAILSQPCDQDTAVKLTVGAAQRADRMFLPVFQQVPCVAGCSHCCHGVRVDVTAPEALTIARGFRETLPAEHVAVIRDHVHRHAERLRAMTLAERHRTRVPCVFLDQASGRCTVYDARPMRCRTHHSLSALDCKAALDHPDEPRVINRYPDVIDRQESMIDAQKRVIATEGLDARVFELTLAVDVALTHEDAEDRWARGEHLFDAAEFTWPDEDCTVR